MRSSLKAVDTTQAILQELALAKSQASSLEAELYNNREALSAERDERCKMSRELEAVTVIVDVNALIWPCYVKQATVEVLKYTPCRQAALRGDLDDHSHQELPVDPEEVDSASDERSAHEKSYEEQNVRMRNRLGFLYCLALLTCLSLS